MQIERGIGTCNSTPFSITPFWTIVKKNYSQTGGTGAKESSARAGCAV
jgi:hypothetical protein